MKTFRPVLFSAVFSVTVWSSASPALGATFNVSTVSGLRNALTAADGNGQSDIINVAAGTYPVSATLTYNSSENYSLTINGAGKSASLLSGGNAVQVLSVTTTAPGAHVVIQNIALQNGNTAQNGGALSVAVSGAANITITNCNFSDSVATGAESISGGAYLTTQSGTATISASGFYRNASAGNVGGLFSGTDSGTANMTNCTFEDNIVDNSAGGGSGYFGDGGGAMFYSDGTSQVTITGNSFSGNTATGGNNPDGGGLMTYQLGADSSVTIQNNTFTGNTAGGGGGCIVRLNAGGDAEISSNSFTNNQSTMGTGAGATVHIDGGTLIYSKNTHTGNISADDGGGAVIHFPIDSATLSDNTFTSNQSVNNGGGLVVTSDSAAVTISRNIFNANTAGNAGGGLSYATTNGTLNAFNNTFYNNSAADGGGVYLYFDQAAASSTVKNNILWHDTPNEVGYSYGAGSGTFVMTYSDVENGSGESWFGTGCISADPLFAEAAGGKFNLTWAGYPFSNSAKSPCIDSGDPTSPPDPDNTRADMGAFPFSQTGQPVASPVTLPGALHLLLLSQ